jgi:hypothetical protein
MTSRRRIQRNGQTRVHGQQVVTPRHQVVDVVLQSHILRSKLVQAGQQRCDWERKLTSILENLGLLKFTKLTVKMLRLFHQKLRTLLPLSLQQLFQTLWRVAAGRRRGRAAQHGAE